MRRYGLPAALLVCLARSDGLNFISAPKAGDTVPAEKLYTIQWSPGTPGPVDIRLHYADTQPIYITQSTSNNGSFSWMPSGVFDGKNNYFLSICDLLIQDECTYTFNGRFAISSGDTSSAVSSAGQISTTPIPSSSSQSSLTATPTPSISSSTVPASLSATATSVPASSGSSGGLSSGATIAIAVVLAILGTTLLAICIFFWYRRRQRQKPGHTEASHSWDHNMVERRGELHGDSRIDKPAELGGNGAYTDRVRPDEPVYIRHELPERAK